MSRITGRWVWRLVRLLGVLAVLYAVGFGLYLAFLPMPFSVPPQGLDGVAVFTGGSGRVDTALDLLRQGFGGPVFISGVHPDVKVRELADPAHLSRVQRARLTLDYQSATTRQNVLATAAWAAERGLMRVGLVTSTYHAVRCRLLFALLAPEVTVVMLPVQPVDTGWTPLLKEYTKVLGAPFIQ